MGTPNVCGKNLDFVFNELEDNSFIATEWFENNYMKMNLDKCHLFTSRIKFEHLCAIIINTDLSTWENCLH